MRSVQPTLRSGNTPRQHVGTAGKARDQVQTTRESELARRFNEEFNAKIYPSRILVEAKRAAYAQKTTKRTRCTGVQRKESYKDSPPTRE